MIRRLHRNPAGPAPRGLVMAVTLHGLLGAWLLAGAAARGQSTQPPAQEEAEAVEKAPEKALEATAEKATEATVEKAEATAEKTPGTTAEKTPEAASEKVPDTRGFKVIVNSDNPSGALEASEVAKMFRKKIRRWDHGVLVVPVDLGPANDVRTLFTRGVHGKSLFAIQSYWQRMIFSGRGAPPEEKASENEVIRHVRANKGGIGYVSSGAPLGTGVKELEVITQ